MNEQNRLARFFFFFLCTGRRLFLYSEIYYSSLRFVWQMAKKMCIYHKGAPKDIEKSILQRWISEPVEMNRKLYITRRILIEMKVSMNMILSVVHSNSDRKQEVEKKNETLHIPKWMIEKYACIAYLVHKRILFHWVFLFQWYYF